MDLRAPFDTRTPPEVQTHPASLDTPTFEVLPGSFPIGGVPPVAPVAPQPPVPRPEEASAFEAVPAEAVGPDITPEDRDKMAKIKKATESLISDTAKNNQIAYEPDANPDGSTNMDAASRNMGAAQQVMGKTLERPTAALEPYMAEEDRKGILETLKDKLEAATDTPQFNWSEMGEDEKSSLLLRLGLNMMSLGGQQGAAQQGLLGVLGAAGQATLDDWDMKAEKERRSKETAAAEDLKAERDIAKEGRVENKEIRNINRSQKVAVAAERRKVLDTIDTDKRKHFLKMEEAAEKHGYNISLEGVRHAHKLSQQAQAKKLGGAAGSRFDKETLAQWNLVSLENPDWDDTTVAKEVSRRHDVRYGSGGTSAEQKAISTANRGVVKDGLAKINDMKSNRSGREWRDYMPGATEDEKTANVMDGVRQTYVDNGVFPTGYAFTHKAETADMATLSAMISEGDSLPKEQQDALRRRVAGLSLAQKKELQAARKTQ